MPLLCYPFILSHSHMREVPTVSVIMPVYNMEFHLIDAINSILSQTFSDLELVIVDDDSTDNSFEIANSFSSSRLKVLRQSRNHGYPVAMNRGIEVAKGKYIARMDADDVSAPKRLEKQIALLESTKDFVFVASRRYWLTPNNKYISPNPMKEELVVETWQDLMKGTRLFTDPSVVVERRLVQEVGCYRTYQRSGQDVDLWLRLLELGRPMGTLTEPLYGRRLLPSAITFSSGTAAKNQIVRTLAEERQKKGTDRVMRGEPIDFPLNELDLNKSHHWRFSALWKTGYQCIEVGDYHGGLSFISHALRSFQFSPQDIRISVMYSLKTLWHFAKGN